MTVSSNSAQVSTISQTFKFEEQSALGKIWKLPPYINVSEDILGASLNSAVIAKVLLQRGLSTEEEIKAFLSTDVYKPCSSMELPDVDRAIVRIRQAISQQEQITVYGDYDVDGITGTSVLITVLRKLGAKVDYYIPNRSGEGYGLNLKAISILTSKHKTKLIITCDCGVSNFAEINFAKSLGVDTLVLDHHTMPELLPPAYGVIHPKRLKEEHPLYHLPGVGVAYKVCEALLIDCEKAEEVENLLDFVTLGMIADMVPLVKDNRYLVMRGLPKLIDSKRVGICALLSQVKSSKDTDLVGFGLAPRINAVGRLSDARLAVELLTTDDENTANSLAKQLQSENMRRQELCERIFFEADLMVKSTIKLDKDRAIFIYKEGWHHGVIGIVASRLVERYNRPVFIGELDPAESLVKGSARGIEAIDLYQVLKANEHLLLKWGGHKMAAGFCVEAEKASTLSAALINTCNNLLSDKALNSVLDIDVITEPHEITMNLAKSLERLAPFGISNKKPLFFMASQQCVDIRPLGKEGKHSRLIFKSISSENSFESVMWNSKGVLPQLNEKVHVVFTPQINSFNNTDRLQLSLSDWRSADNSTKQPEVKTERESASDLEITAKSTETQNIPTITSAPKNDTSNINNRERAFKATKIAWKDLRTQKGNDQILLKATKQFGQDISIFAESLSHPNAHIQTYDRTQLESRPHLLFWQFPPNIAIFQEIIHQSCAQHIYLVGDDNAELNDPSFFLKRLLGLVKFAVNKREGEVESNKLSASMSTTNMSTGLGLTILRKLNMIDWFSQDGIIYLELLAESQGKIKDMPEFHQLQNSLQSIADFRNWCANASLKEIQTAVSDNSIELFGQNLNDVLPTAPDLPSNLARLNSHQGID